jgi:hypothetical protein
MGTLTRTESLTHRVGNEGRVSVKTISGLLRVRGADGDLIKLTVTYRIRAADQAAAERALETGRVLIDRGPSWLEIETPERRISTGLAWLFGGARVGADIDLEVPWGTKVRLETMSGSVEAASLVGDQKYRTVSGDIRLWGLGGLVEASSISGPVTLDNGGDVRIRASSVSGSVKVRARCFYGMTVNTTSGSIAVAGALDPAGDYRADSISGSVSLTPLSGVTAELRTVSGSVSTEIDNRIEGGRGFWRAIVGDGRTVFKVNSTSGGLRILAPGRDSGQPQPVPSYAAPAPAPTAPAAPAAQEAPASPADAAERAADVGAAPDAGIASTGVSESESAPAPVIAGPDRASTAGETGETRSEETWTYDETSEPASEEAADEEMPDELTVLQALERGEIDVDEAAARLERARRSGDVG